MGDFLVESDMNHTDHGTASRKTSVRQQRLAEAIRLHEIEGNPLDAEDLALFEMFERKGWSHERRRKYIIAQAKSDTPVPEAAE